MLFKGNPICVNRANLKKYRTYSPWPGVVGAVILSLRISYIALSCLVGRDLDNIERMGIALPRLLASHKFADSQGPSLFLKIIA